MRKREQLVMLLSAGALLGCSTQLARQSGQDVPVARALPQHRGQVANNPQQSSALSAAAVSQAQAGRLEEAIALFRQALMQEPQAAYLHNNLGYALLLAGRLDEAAPALEQALALNPQSATARKNLATLVESRARQAVQGSQSAPMDHATAAQPLPAAAQTVTVPAVAATGPQIHAVAPQVYALQDQPAAVSAARQVDPEIAQEVAREMAKVAARDTARSKSQAVVATQEGVASAVIAAASGQAGSAPQVVVPAAHAALQGARLEVSNGVGIRYLAKRTAERLASLGLVPARLTNQPGYQQVKTEIQFSRGQKAAADELAAHLPTPVRAVPVAPLERNIQIRLVLGHDLAGKAIASWLDTPAPEAVALDASAGWLWS